MRVTNGMIQNQMLVNLNRNLNSLNSLYQQQMTGKRIIVPSDDPISASRALSLRTSVKEAEQYQKNVEQASSWMEVTEQAYSNTIDIVQRIRELAVEGGNDTLSIEDRQKIATDIESLVEQLGTEMNTTYAGRYVFSGYKTDEEPCFTEDDATASYSITQTFSVDELQNKEMYQKLGTDDVGTITNCDVIRLPYDEIENLTVIDSTGASVTTVSKSSTDADAYSPGADEVYYLEDTGEMILGENVVTKLKAGDISVTYEKTGFKSGDLNPKVYFDCEDINSSSVDFGKTYTTSGQEAMEYEVGTGNRIRVNSMANEVVTGTIYGELTSTVNQILNMTPSTEASLRLKYEAEGYTGDELTAKIEEQLEQEEALMTTSAQDAFSDLIEFCDTSISSVSIQHTNLGSRMNRLELIKTRLEDEESTYTDLLSETEDADLVQVIIELSSAEVIYQSSMKAGTSLIQTSLVDFI